MAQLVKNLPAVWESWVRSLGWEEPLEKGNATHPSILAWRIPWTEEPRGLHGITKCQTCLSNLGFPSNSDVKSLPAMQDTQVLPWVRKIPWRRKWQPTPGLLPGKSHGWRSLVCYSPWGRKEWDSTKRLHLHSKEQEVIDQINIKP